MTGLWRLDETSIFRLYSCKPLPRRDVYWRINNIYARLMEHRDPNSDGYVAKWNASRLVYLEEFQYINEAIDYEKKLKKWRRQWKWI
jgi:hypothetical protein